ncbi:hypothetical protein C8R47DRAFT_1131333 [Mycena vitilis]|nr:hypothetical protein C8R47DRAFT_1131333 [Mycena vitilis]
MSSIPQSTDSVDHPAPLLPVAGGSGSLYGEAWLTEKDFDPAVLFDGTPPTHPDTPASRGPLKMQAYASKLLRWPTPVILGQLVIQCFGWGFFITVKVRGEIPLPSDRAVWVKNNGHLVTLVVTLMATVLSTCTSFLFSYAIRRSMSLSLNRPVSLATLGASVSISTRSIVFHRRSWKWPTISLLVLILTGVQTSGWSTLLTPVPVIISTPLLGSEIDLSSPILHQMWDDSSDTMQSCMNQTMGSTTAYSLVPESGYAALSAALGQESTTMVLNQAFNRSTGGVLPALLHSLDVSALTVYNSSSIPATVHPMSSPPGTFSSNYSLDQQGFTVDVSCSFQNLANFTAPSLTFSTFDVAFQGAYNITFSSISSTCDAPAGTTRMMQVMLILCKPDNYSAYTRLSPAAILTFNGRYGGFPTTVCSVVPKITRLHANYASLIDTELDSGSTVIQDPDGPTAYVAMQNVFNAVALGQSIEVNELGDRLTAMIQPNSPQDALKPLLEAYIQGSAEYTASIFRACLMANTTFSGGVPSNMTVPIHGTLRTETMGWTYVSGTTRWVLIPGTVIALATVCVVAAALYRHVGEIPEESDQFDLSDPMHLMAAASAGGLNNAFKGLSRKDMKEGEKLNVVLGSIPGRGPALVRADEYRPVFSDAFSPRSA